VLCINCRVYAIKSQIFHSKCVIVFRNDLLLARIFEEIYSGDYDGLQLVDHYDGGGALQRFDVIAYVGGVPCN